jgi:hypothetical protein
MLLNVDFARRSSFIADSSDFSDLGTIRALLPRLSLRGVTQLHVTPHCYHHRSSRRSAGYPGGVASSAARDFQTHRRMRRSAGRSPRAKARASKPGRGSRPREQEKRSTDSLPRESPNPREFSGAFRAPFGLGRDSAKTILPVAPPAIRRGQTSTPVAGRTIAGAHPALRRQ